MEEDNDSLELLSVDALGPKKKKKKKRKGAVLVEEQPRNAKKMKSANKSHPTTWIEDETATLLEGVKKHGLDFERIQVREWSSAWPRVEVSLINGRKAHSKIVCAVITPDKLRELKPPSNVWTEEETAALFEGVEKHGLDLNKIKAESGDRLDKRSKVALYSKLHRQKIVNP
ncbi:hypothetical protein TrLO_g903 [Triparma laevis f. longispina]|uniref:Myb-like domain-containing protein n=1 Tax=Triparma laevis f. longispina TaxID=1714387 RepID=A0A9W6ZVZ2_9STRA|nr:hypothetical protein TrLO_g903 [Triparma laevis f. longispina]